MSKDKYVVVDSHELNSFYREGYALHSIFYEESLQYNEYSGNKDKLEGYVMGNAFTLEGKKTYVLRIPRFLMVLNSKAEALFGEGVKDETNS